MAELKIEYLPIDEITPYDNNAKLHPEEQIEQIEQSIKDFGFNDPIAVAGEDNTIIEGHGRYEAAKELGIEEVPVIRLDSLTEEQRKAYGLVHNKITMNSGFDFAKLSEELDAVMNDYDMTDFGFNSFVMDNDDEDFEPEEFDKEIEEEYPEKGLKSFNCIISCVTEEEKEWLGKFLREDGECHRLIDCSKLMERFENEEAD